MLNAHLPDNDDPHNKHGLMIAHGLDFLVEQQIIGKACAAFIKELVGQHGRHPCIAVSTRLHPDRDATCCRVCPLARLAQRDSSAARSALSSYLASHFATLATLCGTLGFLC